MVIMRIMQNSCKLHSVVQPKWTFRNLARQGFINRKTNKIKLKLK